jgi:hypothetical protein
MNRESNKEIDILLRKLSGKQNGDAAAAESNSSASAPEHLDTDELSAYAENALPASLRSRYTEHLADCNSCRKLVTQLSLSSTAAIVQAPVGESAPSRRKAFFAGWFSPLVIRYAVPAMAVILVVAIAWIVMRREPAYEQVAKNTETKTQPSLADQSSSPSSPGVDQIANDSSAPQKGLVEERHRAQPQATPSEERAAVSSDRSKTPEESKEGQVAAKRDQPAPPAASVTVVAPSTGGTTVAQTKSVSEVERNEPEPKKKAEADVAKVQNQNQAPIQNQDRRYEQNRSGPSEPKAVQRGVTNTQRSNESQRELARQRALTPEAQAKDKASDDEAEVRTVGGHKFTKRGRVWVDALYDSDSATTNVSRGSEQYRSLMGDEPGLRDIVEQLRGEVLVVWKSRSYRIK